MARHHVCEKSDHQCQRLGEDAEELDERHQWHRHFKPCGHLGPKDILPISFRSGDVSYQERAQRQEESAGDIAREVDRNPTYISHVFRAVTGETLFEYITRLRMELAMKLLRESSMKIQEIAAETGYEEQSYFSQVFKKYTGKTAGSYRKMMYKDE